MPRSIITIIVSFLLLQSFRTLFLLLYSPTPTISSLLREMSVTTYDNKHLIFYWSWAQFGLVARLGFTCIIYIGWLAPESRGPFNHWCCKICFKEERSSGLYRRQRWIKFWTSSETGTLKCSFAARIWSSVAKGMLPQTMSYNRMPNDHTVAGSAWYWLCWIHSGVAYTLVPKTMRKKTRLANCV